MTSKKHILLIDDMTTNLKVVGEVLKDNYTLSMAKSGPQALQLLDRMTPDLILLDVMMPEMDGYQTLEAIRKVAGCSKVPVVFMTTDNGTANEVRGFELGAMDYIHKPMAPELVRSRIARVIKIDEDRKDLAIKAVKDSLTGLWTRKYLEERFDASETMPEQGAFLLLDLDNFKQVNDCYGHIAGDEVLTTFGQVLFDFASAQDIVCRMGGDEFAIFISGEIDMYELKSRLEKLILDSMDKVNAVKGPACKVTVSIGVSMYPADGDDFATLYKKADKALYHVKQNGKTGYHVYNDKQKYTVFGMEGSNHKTVDMDQLMESFHTYSRREGALAVEYEGFRRIVEFVARTLARSNQNVQMVLFSVTEDADTKGVSVSMLEDCITGELRRGDVYTRFSNTQILLILMDAKKENAGGIIHRVFAKLERKLGRAVKNVSYDVRDIHRENTL